MGSISNDVQFRDALNALGGAQQREVGARFVESALHLTGDKRVAGALAADSDEDAHDDESQAQYRTLTSYLDA